MYKEMDAGTMYQTLGADADKWADAFIEITGCNIAKDVMFAWVCNMMMAKVDFANGQQPVLCGDHADWLQSHLKD